MDDRRRRDARNGDLRRAEDDLAVVREPSSDQVLQHLVLRIDGHGSTTGERMQVDAVSGAVEANLEAVMVETFSLQPFANAGFDHQIDGALFQHAGADRRLDRIARPGLDDHRCNAGEMEQV